LYPPIIVPKISIAFSGLIDLQYFSEFAIAVSQLAFTYAASSTPGGTLFISKSSKYDES